MSEHPDTHLLFSYGTLQLPAVQEAVFGGPVAGAPDAVGGHVLDRVRIDDPRVVALSGSDVHPLLVPSPDPCAQVPGTVLSLDDAQLAAADAYEVGAYSRVARPLVSGRTAWVYVLAPTTPTTPTTPTSPTTPTAADGEGLVRRRVVVSGLGAVGGSLVRLLHERAEDLRHRHGLVLTLVGAVDSRGAAVAAGGLDPGAVLDLKAGGSTVAALAGSGRPGSGVPQVLDELGDGVDVLVEAGPGDLVDGGPGLVAVLDARRRGLQVVLANKAPLALAWDAVTSEAGGSAPVRYSGCVGGALPSVDLGRRVLASASALRVESVLNSTCQLVLRLVEAGSTSAEAVSEAQRRGVAEPDPSLDVDGWDAAVKLVILAGAVLGRPTGLSEVDVTGIREVDTTQLRAARRRGQAVVLLGLAERSGADEDWHLSVRPTALPAEHPLARMDAAETGVVLHTDVAGRVSATGLATDALPTAAAVLRDLVDLATTASSPPPGSR